MDGQMDIFSFIEPKPKEDKPKHPRVWKLEETEPDYLGVVSPDHAETVKGHQLNFAELDNMIGKRILYRSRYWLHMHDGTKEHNQYMIVKVISYAEDFHEIYDEAAPDDGVVGHADGCLVQVANGHPIVPMWLNELFVYGGKDAEDVGYKKREFIYELKEANNG